MISTNLNDARKECSTDPDCKMFYESFEESFQHSSDVSRFYNCTASSSFRQSGCKEKDIMYSKGNLNEMFFILYVLSGEDHNFQFINCIFLNRNMAKGS